MSEIEMQVADGKWVPVTPQDSASPQTPYPSSEQLYTLLNAGPTGLCLQLSQSAAERAQTLGAHIDTFC